MRRGICKVCRRRRQVNVGTYRCRECASAVGESPPPRDVPEQNVQVVQRTASPFVQVDASAIRQLQMLSVFLQAYTPKLQHRRAGDSANLSYFALLPSMDLSSPLLGSAVDCLCFAHIGRGQADPRLLEVSRHRYGNALASLGSLIQRSQLTVKSQREIMTSIILISLYDESLPLAHRADNSWVTHYLGVQQYLETAGPSSFSRGERDDVLLLGNLLPPLFMLSMARRKAVVFSRAVWQSTLNLTVILRQYYPFLLDLPGFLEMVDIDIDEGGPLMANACDEIDLTLVSEIRWFRPGIVGKPPGIIDISESPTLNSDIEEHCVMACNDTFRTVYWFSHPTMASRANVVWVTQLTAECTLLRIMHTHPEQYTTLKHSGRTAEQVKLDAINIATNLCLSVHYLSGLASIAWADFIRVIIETALAFFTEAECEREMEWCHACLLATLARKARMQDRMPPTLCRLGGLASQFAANVLYRSGAATMVLPTHFKARDCPVVMEQPNGYPEESYPRFTELPHT